MSPAQIDAYMRQCEREDLELKLAEANARYEKEQEERNKRIAEKAAEELAEAEALVQRFLEDPDFGDEQCREDIQRIKAEHPEWNAIKILAEMDALDDARRAALPKPEPKAKPQSKDVPVPITCVQPSREPDEWQIIEDVPGGEYVFNQNGDCMALVAGRGRTVGKVLRLHRRWKRNRKTGQPYFWVGYRLRVNGKRVDVRFHNALLQWNRGHERLATP